MTERDIDTEATEPTELEKYLGRKYKSFLEKKNLSAFEMGRDFYFPMLRRVAKEQADLEDTIAELQEAVGVSGGVGAVAIRALQESNAFILRLAGLIDQAMVAGGLVEVTEKGLKPTERGNGLPGLVKEYAEIGEAVRNIAVNNQNAIEAIEESMEDDDDDDDDDAESGEGDPVPDAPNGKGGAHDSP